MKRTLALAALLLLALPTGAQQTDDFPHYEIAFEARIVPTQRHAEVVWRLGVGSAAVRELTLFIDPQRHSDFRGAGTVEVEGDRVRWVPPERGGTLRYRFRIDHIRDEGGYDARCSESWALFRGDDLFPRARVRTLKDARSVSILRLKVPQGWSTVTRFERSAPDTFEVHDPLRRFDRPTGWMVMGELGVLRERIGGSRVAFAGPTGNGVRRHDGIAFLRWTLPQLKKILGELPDRLLVTSAGDPMWRGGLGAPHSLFLHADRPWISSDGTSPLLHELIHAVTRTTAGSDGDWIVEGLAEYYSLQLLRRSKTFSKSRYRKVLDRLAEKARRGRLARRASSGADTARAVLVLRALDLEIRERSGGSHSLDDVLAALASRPRAITTDDFRTLTADVTGLALDDFFGREVSPRLE